MFAITMATLAMVGSPAQPKRSSDIHSSPPEPADSYALRGKGNALYAAGKLADAIRIYRTGAEAARARRDARSQIRFLNNMGVAELSSFRYRDAIRSFMQ